MARIRTIKPQHCSDKELPTISLQAHLLWVLNWCFSDDQGVFENDPLLIKSNIFPRRQDVRTEQISQWIDQLAKARYIIPFTHNGVGYYINRTFNTHQKIDRPQPSNIPEDLIRRILDEYSTNVRPCNVEESKGEERKKPIGFSPTEKQKISFEKFKEWMKKEVPEVERMPKPITIEEYVKLTGEYPDKKSPTGFRPGISKPEVIEYLQAIENNKEYLKKFRSPYLCVLAWHKKDRHK